MGMPLPADYIFLAVVLAPALVLAGVPELSAHMFILYVGMLASITPPSRSAAFPAAELAKTSPMKVACSGQACIMKYQTHIFDFRGTFRP
jgi:TRAP-type uncharacterized transport system fused permease subunit